MLVCTRVCYERKTLEARTNTRLVNSLQVVALTTYKAVSSSSASTTVFEGFTVGTSADVLTICTALNRSTVGIP